MLLIILLYIDSSILNSFKMYKNVTLLNYKLFILNVYFFSCYLFTYIHFILYFCSCLKYGDLHLYLNNIILYYNNHDTIDTHLR